MSYKLITKFDSRASFYYKAHVTETDNKLVLCSYSTDVCVIDLKTNKAKVNSDYSMTTNRHIKEFLKQNGFKAENTKQILKDYLIKEVVL